VPDAVTEKEVLFPSQTVVFEGCEVTAGAAFMVIVAAFEVAAGEQAPLTMHLYWYPFKPAAAPVIDNVEVVTFE
jgi:hypothetical protein